MRALLAAAFAVSLFVSGADARVLVVRPRGTTPASTPGASGVENRADYILRRVLDNLGVSYVMVDGRVARTEFCRTGVMTWNFGQAGARADTFDAVIHAGFEGRRGSASVTGADYRPDSLTLTGLGGCTVPQLFLGDNRWAFGSFGLAACGDWADATTDTTGATGTGGSANQTIGPHPHLVGSDIVWANSVYTEGSPRNSTSPAGGLRQIVSITHINANHRWEQSGLNCIWCDSTNLANNDTMLVWERPWAHKAGASHQVFCRWGGAGGNDDSISTASAFNAQDRPPCELDVPMLLIGLARLDSLTGGKVFGRNSLPRKGAIVIRGGFSRSSRRLQGLYPSDSTTLIACIDSLAAYHIPVTVGVNVDSINSYPSEKTWWNRWIGAHFAPDSRDGADTTVAGLTTTSVTRVIDPFGRWRKRAAYGDGSAIGSDTSMFALGRSELNTVRSTFGDARTSRVAFALNDDWSPVNYQQVTAESTLYALAKGGYVAVLSDGQSRFSRPQFSPANPWGYGYTAGTYREPYGGRDIKVLAHNGNGITGGATQIIGFTSATVDTTPPVSLPQDQITMFPTREVNRFWKGLLVGKDRDNDVLFMDGWWEANCALDGIYENNEDRWSMLQAGTVKQFYLSDFSGIPNGPPARNGWWATKWIWNAMRAVNKVANCTVVTLDYPEAVKP